MSGRGRNSHSHIMLGSAEAWYYKTFAGLEPLEAGWRRIRYAPHPVGATGVVELRAPEGATLVEGDAVLGQAARPVETVAGVESVEYTEEAFRLHV